LLTIQKDRLCHTCIAMVVARTFRLLAELLALLTLLPALNHSSRLLRCNCIDSVDRGPESRHALPVVTDCFCWGSDAALLAAAMATPMNKSHKSVYVSDKLAPKQQVLNKVGMLSMLFLAFTFSHPGISPGPAGECILAHMSLNLTI